MAHQLILLTLCLGIMAAASGDATADMATLTRMGIKIPESVIPDGVGGTDTPSSGSPAEGKEVKEKDEEGATGSTGSTGAPQRQFFRGSRGQLSGFPSGLPGGLPGDLSGGLTRPLGRRGGFSKKQRFPVPGTGKPSKSTAQSHSFPSFDPFEWVRGVFEEMGQKVVEALNANAELIPSFIQMSFHDCVEGCDGCIDLTTAGNTGLGPALNKAKEIRDEVAPWFSLADTIAYIGTKTLAFACDKADEKVTVPFSIGRQDCFSGFGVPLPRRDIPHGRITNAVRRLQRLFGVRRKEAVALMGCHSLGKCSAEFSGFEGPWDRSQDKLDRGYLFNLVNSNASDPDRRWVAEIQSNNNVDSSQWNKGGRSMMLHADMSLFKRFRTDRNNKDMPSCTFETCPPASTARFVTRFVDNKDDFYSTLVRAYPKMVNTVSLPWGLVYIMDVSM